MVPLAIGSSYLNGVSVNPRHRRMLALVVAGTLAVVVWSYALSARRPGVGQIAPTSPIWTRRVVAVSLATPFGKAAKEVKCWSTPSERFQPRFLQLRPMYLWMAVSPRAEDQPLVVRR